MWYMNEEREMIASTVKQFAENELKPFVNEMEENEAVPKDLILKMAQLGFLKFGINPELTGYDRKDIINHALVIEELGKISNTFAVLCNVQSMFYSTLANSCTPEQTEKYFMPALDGKAIIGSCANESLVWDVSTWSTKAKQEGDEWVINGSKVLITFAEAMDTAMIIAMPEGEINPQLGFFASQIFLAPTSTPGFKVGHIERKVGWHGSSTGQIYFNDVRVPEADRIPTDGYVNSMYEANVLGFVGYGSAMLGSMEGVLAQTIAYLKDRNIGGVSYWDAHESIRFDIARLWQKVDLYRNAVYSCAAEAETGSQSASLTSTALKYEGSYLLEKVASECMTLCGGVGVVSGTGIERFYRDAKICAMACGSINTNLATISSVL